MKNKGFFSYYVMIVFSCLIIMFQGLYFKTVNSEVLVQNEMEYITCLYGVERGVIWLLTYLSEGKSIKNMEPLLCDNEEVAIGFQSLEEKDDHITCVVFCEHKISKLVVRKQVELLCKNKADVIKIDIIQVKQL